MFEWHPSHGLALLLGWFADLPMIVRWLILAAIAFVVLGASAAVV